jgi:hypothetical protein
MMLVQQSPLQHFSQTPLKLAFCEKNLLGHHLSHLLGKFLQYFLSPLGATLPPCADLPSFVLLPLVPHHPLSSFASRLALFLAMAAALEKKHEA